MIGYHSVVSTQYLLLIIRHMTAFSFHDKHTYILHFNNFPFIEYYLYSIIFFFQKTHNSRCQWRLRRVHCNVMVSQPLYQTVCSLRAHNCFWSSGSLKIHCWCHGWSERAVWWEDNKGGKQSWMELWGGLVALMASLSRWQAFFLNTAHPWSTSAPYQIRLGRF